MTTPAIEAIDVTRVYSMGGVTVEALRGVTVRIEAGEYASIVGPSGSGKSTLMHLLGLLDRPSSGVISVGGRDATSLSDTELAALRNQTIGFVFQSFHLVPDLTVLDNVEIPLLYRRSSTGERRRLALAALDRVGLASRVHHYPAQLSGGQQQRVAVARAIVGRPRLLLADEPTGNLDSQMGDEIMALLQALNAEGATVVMVTHDPRLAERAHRTVRLFDGRQVQ